ncbi:MAG: Putative monooxygenase STM1546 [uncultured Truepera sp.]|uniref:Monooxygenase STM1546 n=1 Tax=uncultured Truepera sp. TaxID=543023 RepID=A0A6J4VCH1_9DEIN|nr:MAG: Putative monooxygenase STM1546 [uncultured Truepera sp.]
MENTGHTEVLIAGAGPTGLLLALWLTRLGVKARIVDPKPGPTEESRAIGVQARTMEFYDQLGLGAEALTRGRHFDAVNLWVQGRLRSQVRLRGVGDDLTPHPYLYILTQDQNETMLLEHLEKSGGAVAWRTELSGFTQDENGVSATLRRGDATETVHAAFLAGCDGARSTVRHGLSVPFTGGTQVQTFYVADVSVTGKLREGDMNLSLDDTHFSAFFPMPEPNRHRVVGQLPEGADEHVTFESVRPEVEAHGLARVGDVHWFSTYRSHHRVAERFRVGRAFLLGDAGHVHSPVGGQGMNTGLGDAANLAWKLAQALRGGDLAVLNTYETERRPFAVSLVNTTDRVFSGVVNPSALARFIRTWVVPAVLPILVRPRAVRRRMFLTVSQTRIHYPDSPLSTGQAGRVRGGDRLPWVPDGASSNYGALKSLDWQLHVYGSLTSEVQTWCAAWGLPLHVFPFSRVARRAGLTQNALYLVRPDGYVGMAVPRFEQASLDAYAERWLPKVKSGGVQAGQ